MLPVYRRHVRLQHRGISPGVGQPPSAPISAAAAITAGDVLGGAISGATGPSVGSTGAGVPTTLLPWLLRRRPQQFPGVDMRGLSLQTLQVRYADVSPGHTLPCSCLDEMLNSARKTTATLHRPFLYVLRNIQYFSYGARAYSSFPRV